MNNLNKIYNPRGQQKKPDWKAKFVLWSVYDNCGRHHYAVYKRTKTEYVYLDGSPKNVFKQNLIGESYAISFQPFKRYAVSWEDEHKLPTDDRIARMNHNRAVRQHTPGTPNLDTLECVKANKMDHLLIKKFEMFL